MCLTHPVKQHVRDWSRKKFSNQHATYSKDGRFGFLKSFLLAGWLEHKCFKDKKGKGEGSLCFVCSLILLKYIWFTIFVNFCYTAKWLSYIYIYIYTHTHILFKILFSIYHRILNIVYNRILNIVTWAIQ